MFEYLAGVQERCEDLINGSNKNLVARQVLLVGPVGAMCVKSHLYINEVYHFKM